MGVKCTHVRLDFEDGEVRELFGNKATAWLNALNAVVSLQFATTKTSFPQFDWRISNIKDWSMIDFDVLHKYWEAQAFSGSSSGMVSLTIKGPRGYAKLDYEGNNSWGDPISAGALSEHDDNEDKEEIQT